MTSRSSPRQGRRLSASVVLCAASFVTFPTSAQESRCGPLENHYGPFDYRKEQKGKLAIVESAHFAPQVEALRSGQTGAIGGDLNYVLHTSPNHHRALNALVRLAEREKTSKPFKMEYTVDCYFERAVRFAPDDTVVRGLLALYLKKQGKTEPAVAQMDYASSVAGDNPFSHYNIGMVYLELGQPDKAAASARRARELGLERPELIDKLKARGKWVEPVATSAPEASAPAEAPASAPASVASKP